MSEKDISIKIKTVKLMEATEKIKVVYKDTSKDDELTGIYSDKASPEFYTTMEKLNAIAAGIYQFADEYAKRLHVYGVTYHYSKDGTMGAMLHCKMELVPIKFWHNANIMVYLFIFWLKNCFNCGKYLFNRSCSINLANFTLCIIITNHRETRLQENLEPLPYCFNIVIFSTLVPT